MIRMLVGAILLAGSLYSAIANAEGPENKASTCEANQTDAPKLLSDGGDRASFEAAVNDVLRHFDAGDYAGLAAEISAGTTAGDATPTDIEGMADLLRVAAEHIDADTGRRFASMDLFARIEGSKHDPAARYAMLSHLRMCAGRVCEEQVVMKEVDHRWQLFGLYIYAASAPTPGKAP